MLEPAGLSPTQIPALPEATRALSFGYGQILAQRRREGWLDGNHLSSLIIHAIIAIAEVVLLFDLWEDASADAYHPQKLVYVVARVPARSKLTSQYTGFFPPILMLLFYFISI
jgi:hypothetical protein